MLNQQFAALAFKQMLSMSAMLMSIVHCRLPGRFVPGFSEEERWNPL
jgi:hypothetical protein